MAQAETGADNQEAAPSNKSKKSQRKGKVSSGSETSDSKSGARKDDDSLGAISEEWVIQKITSLNPDFEEQDLDDPEMILFPLARHLRPLLLNAWKERRKVAFAEITQKLKKLLDDMQ